VSAPKKITSLYAWVATVADGGEGIPAAIITMADGNCAMPLFGADMDRMNSLRGEAVALKRQLGVARMRLCRFQLADELDEL
jgi:hypothetical protein